MKTPQRKIKFLEASEFDKLIASIKQDSKNAIRDVALLETLFSTGLRISEALALPDAPFVSAAQSRTFEIDICGKGGYQRVVYFSPRAMRAIKAWLDARDDSSMLLFPITARWAQAMMKERGRYGLGKAVNPHMLRHSLATDLLRKGVDIAFVSKFLGHRNINNTLIYTHIVNNDLHEIHTKLYT